MRDDKKPIPVEKLPKYLQTLLKNREYPDTVISAFEVAQEYAGWELGDERWADQIINIYNEAIDASPTQ